MLADPSATNKLTRTIIGCGIRVHTVVGPGLLESTYEACMAFELKESGLDVERRKHVPLIYRGLQLPIAYQFDARSPDSPREARHEQLDAAPR